LTRQPRWLALAGQPAVGLSLSRACGASVPDPSGWD
jgi:hypothetical protein